MKLSQPDYTDNILHEFIQLLKKDPDMQELSLSAQKELWERIERKNKRQERNHVRLLIWSGSVAATICLLFVATWFNLSSPQPAKVDYTSLIKNFGHIDQTSTDVLLVLSNNQKISIEGQEAQLHYEEEGWVQINNKEKMAVEEKTEGGQIKFNQLVVPIGKRSMLTFNDGTRIWINSGSKLIYPVSFTQNKREVFVEGEIFLDVSPDPKRPFIVSTNSLDVKVLGTQFNVSAYTDQSDLQVVLVSGQVEIQRNGNTKEILKPNQLFSFNEQTQDFYISTVDVADYIAWKNGYYSFHHQDLGMVLSKLSKYYDVQFTWDEKIKDLKCSGKLDLKEDLQEVLSMLEKTAPIEIQNTTKRKYTVIVKH